MWISVRREDGKWKLVQRVIGVVVWRWEGEDFGEMCEVLQGQFEAFKTPKAMMGSGATAGNG